MSPRCQWGREFGIDGLDERPCDQQSTKTHEFGSHADGHRNVVHLCAGHSLTLSMNNGRTYWVEGSLR